MSQNDFPAPKKASLSFATVISRLRDPLLAVTYAAALLSMAGLVILAVVSTGTSVLIWAIRSRVSEAMAGIKYLDAARMPFLISMNLLMVAVMAVVGFVFLRQLRRVIISVAEGNPFGEDNARRLTVMGCLTVAANLLAMYVGGFGAWFAVLTHAQNPSYATAAHGLGFDPSAWLLTLVLFVLARVFKQGAAMQLDLEGTV